MLHNNRKALARPANCYACESATVCVRVCVLGLVLAIASYGCNLQAQADRETNTER